MPTIKVAILGGSGYTARELLRILLRHPHAEIIAVTSRQSEWIADLHPILMNRLRMRTTQFDPVALQSQGVECVFSCLPHGASMEAIPPLLERGFRVIDLSADYRLRDPKVYEKWYHEPHRDLSNLSQAVYGLPELYPQKIHGAQLIANPGCYPQTGILGLLPLVREELIQFDSIIIDSKSGVSGGGREPKKTFHFPECNESVSAYGVGTHRHTPEIEQALSDVAGQPVQVIFTPHLIPMDRGILSTIYVHPKRRVDEAELLRLYKSCYATSPFIRVRTDLPATKDTSGTNFLDIAIRVVRDRILIVACEDNLIRGASGVAVQNFNIMHGFEESTALL